MSRYGTYDLKQGFIPDDDCPIQRKDAANMAELKPCPFCGHKAVVEDCGDNSYFVRCSYCSINQDKLYAQKCDAVKAWNRRADNG